MLLCLGICLQPGAENTITIRNPSLTDALRQQLQKKQQILQNGAVRLEAKQTTLKKAAEEGEEEKETLAFFARRQKGLQNEISFYAELDEFLQDLQEKAAPPKPESEELPDIYRQFLAENALSLPHGGVGGGPGFGRACSADLLNGEDWEESWQEEWDLNTPDSEPSQSGSAANAQLDPGSGSKRLLLPAAGVISAGTWAYPSGALHLGMDLALPMYTPIKAPADGVILYAASVTGDGGGYLGNWVGWPYGGGNTIAMICRSGSQLYGVALCHLSSRIQVRPGQKVRQGDVVAYSGNTGNSTGPHTHIELFRLKVSFEQAVSYFQQGADFSFGTGWSIPAACSDIACQVRPELYMGS